MTGIQRVAFNGNEVAVKGLKVQPQIILGKDTTVFKFDKTEPTDSLYSKLGLNLSSIKTAAANEAQDSTKNAAVASEEQNNAENADEVNEQQGGEGKAAAGQGVTVGDGNGTTIIIIGDNNDVHVDKDGKVDEAKKTEEAEEPEEVTDAEGKETEAAENNNKKVIETLKDIIVALLKLINGEEKVEQVEKEEPTKDVPADKKANEEEPAKEEPAPKTGNAQKIEALKEIIIKLLGLVQAEEEKVEEPKTEAPEAEEAKEEEEEEPKLAD